MFLYRVHEEGPASCNLVLCTIEKTTGGDIRIITAGIQCAMFVETYGKKIAQTVFRGSYEGGTVPCGSTKRTVATEESLPQFRKISTFRLEN